MAGLKFSNNAKSLLLADIDASSTQLFIRSEDAYLFPEITQPGDWFPLAITDEGGQVEYLRCTDRNYYTLTVQRGADGSQARAHALGAIVDVRLNRDALEELTAGLASDLAQLTQNFANYQNQVAQELQQLQQLIDQVANSGIENGGGTISGDLHVTGNVTVDGGLAVTGQTTLHILIAGDTTVNDLHVQGTTYAVVIKATDGQFETLTVDGKELLTADDFGVITGSGSSKMLKLPDGYGISFGVINSLNADGVGTANFPAQYASTPTVVPVPLGTSSTNPSKYRLNIVSVNAAGFSAQGSGFGPAAFHWIAIGKLP